MKMLLLVLLSLSAFATETQLVSLGQSTGGSFYLDNNRNFLRNPATLGKYNQLSYDVDAKDFIYNANELVLAGGRLGTNESSVLAGYKFTDTLAASVYTGITDGTFFDDMGFTFGFDMDGAEAYIGYDRIKKTDKEAMTGGLVLPMDMYTLFAEYSDVLDSKDYSLLVGLSYEFGKKGMVTPFADLSYNRVKGGKQGLILTAGLTADAYKDWVLMASVKHDFLFDNKSILSAGGDYSICKGLVLGASISASPITTSSVKFGDLDTKLSLTYSL